jgi:hypothetical protein
MSTNIIDATSSSWQYRITVLRLGCTQDRQPPPDRAVS